MQTRRSAGLTPLSIVLPHPSLPRRRSTILSLVPSPRTPLSCASPTSSLLFSGAANRKSTDSWNSSNQDLIDDLDYDWKPDQILFLRRTLDALPPHLYTPFNGPIPPSNLLDKIARGVAQAKGEDWPHSLRATRTKLIELARTLADEDSKIHKTIPEENVLDTSRYPSFTEGDVLQPTTNIGRVGIGLNSRRPLYRQSSMDFLNTSEPKPDDSISRLSKRLQKTDRLIPNPNYHPYSRSQINRRSSSPPKPNHVPSLISPSTPSSSTLSSLTSISAAGHPRTLRRSMSITSSSTTSSSRMSLGSVDNLPPINDPRVTRIRRSESFCMHPVEPRRAVKRAPSYGALAQESRVTDMPSSDEEEKDRTRRAKKPRVRSDSATTPPLSPSPGPSPTPSPAATKSGKSAGPSKRKTAASVRSSESTGPSKSTRQRTSSMFGPELAPIVACEAPTTPLLSAAPLLQAPGPEKVKTLRRVRRLPAARRISFGSLIAPVGENGHEADMEERDEEHALGSAFQLR
ncbi:hypothetical protein MIND_00257400 [Mycena indigotica]|uniref:Uncharacterized protein n=1 Tax=Mycena indigotica TaxID=2126181 RepID=A0A8H6T7Z2_9AGAR|nr:uncharacterized protein MIND_00257400 [Mycena indigotica]KAF7312439.1 hypothetical protein MIND_00257400 [Mycena indigotica]